MSNTPRLAAAKRDWGHDDSGCHVLHIDMDAFYASCEVARHPELKGKPVIIGTGTRSVVSAASYEARPYGINSAMPVSRARHLCPQGIFLPVDMRYYREISRRIFSEVFARITDNIEQVSVDEGYMDVSAALQQWSGPRAIGAWIRQHVSEQFHVTCSVGIAANKLVAKMASTNAKPDGMLLIPVSKHAAFVQMMPLRGIPGIGPSLEKRLSQWGIGDVAELTKLDEKEISRVVGSSTLGHHLFLAARGQDERTLSTKAREKSIGAERTFAQDTTDPKTVTTLLRQCSDDVASSLRKHALLARTITVKLRFADLSYATKAHTLERPVDTASAIYPEAMKLFRQMFAENNATDGDSSARPSPTLPRAVRLAGVSASGLSKSDETPIQLTIEDLMPKETADDARPERLSEAERTLDTIRKRYGKNAVHLGL
ncbi:DNA polymerase IV [Bifidobacterium crudilactis]|jgi:DNA polymerase-4|uniref:DNA polymerase IV n=1 Tax=Bifidobacterium crudilactis TaxID=327277 RepID=A0A971CZJ1_9BIFI|nr:DNA polymerase IV [Bifidobacterium crudilactis]MCI1868416.1 DNA polymerase IV [Bifidobacterium crudilactis]MDN5972047.1 DNA polymerase IV [Bifidobacterium crudilactis]MDN6001615.1 DNA polymerase IV [Bifidobacterium crudilactis]MDN6209745.1 DNA polymerase IV [Bifidobacterium crudilactis]MDN6425144.1 DNA polymerase IV [Bifidobacterium crudilactis]